MKRRKQGGNEGYSGERRKFAGKRRSTSKPDTVISCSMTTRAPEPSRVALFQQQSPSWTANQRRVRSIVWLTLVFWSSNFLLSTLSTALSGNPRLWPVTGMLALTMTLGLLFCFLIHLLLRRLPTTKSRLIALAIVAPVAAETFAWAVFFSQASVDPTITLRNFQWSAAIKTISFWTWFFLAWAGSYLTVSYSFDIQDEQARTAELKELAHEAQLRALQNQINPHFLFNSLNSLSSLILDGENVRAERMVTKLASLLRRSLAADPSLKITLSEELDLQRSYLEMEQVRFEDLSVEIDAPPELLDIKIPALILQPILENAVKYGVTGAPPPARIAIRAWCDKQSLFVETVNSGEGSKPVKKSSGIGLNNVIGRLEANYGATAVGLTAAKLGDGSFATTIFLPIERS